jgi:hypothetical protein
VTTPAITPTPTPDEAAAIVVALDAFTSSSGVVDTDAKLSSVWRFSGRWWVGSTVVRRTRPHG